MSVSSPDVVIAGGSFVGLATAVGLARAGLTVAVIEKRPHQVQHAAGDDGRVSAIALGTQRFLASLGIWPAIREAQPIRDIRIADGDLTHGDSLSVLNYDHRQVGRDPFGWMVANSDLLQACWETASALPSLSLRQGVAVQGWETNPAGVAVTLDQGEQLQARLLIAADGRLSRLRDQAGIGYRRKAYGQTALVGCVRHEKPHRGLAIERFLPAGPFAMLPMTDTPDGIHRSAYVWTESDAMAKGLFALPEPEYRFELQRRFGDAFGAVASLGGRWIHLLELILPDRLTAPRLALVGDAAHAIHPVAGQGVNLGLRDTEALLPLVLEQARLGLDIGGDELLARYAAARRFDTHSMAEVTNGLVGLFSNRQPVLRAGRRLGLGLVEQLPPLKRLFMRHAMGVLLPSGS